MWTFGVPNACNAFRHYTDSPKTFKTPVKDPSYQCFRLLRPQVKEAKEPADPRDAWLWVPDDLSAEDVPLASGVSISAPRMVACGAAVV